MTRRVLMLHGLGSSTARDFPAESWAAPLAARGLQTIAPGLPGHERALLDRAESLDALLDALAATVEGEADVVGYSLGGRLAWSLVESGRVRARKVVLGGMGPGDPLPFVRWDAVEAAGADGAGLDGIDAVMHGVVQHSAVPHDTIALTRILADEPFVPGTISPPALLVRGSDDPIAADMPALLELAPNGSLLDVPGDHVTAIASGDFRAAAIPFLIDRSEQDLS